MYCPNCGKPVDDKAMFCATCGMPLRQERPLFSEVPDDSSYFLFAILGFFLPVAGIIIFLIYEKTNPKRAKAAAKGAAVGLILPLIAAAVAAIAYFVFFTSLLSKF